MAGCRRTREILLEGVRISVFPTASTVNTRDMPPVLGATSSHQVSYLPGLTHHPRSRTFLSLSTSSRCTPSPERSQHYPHRPTPARPVASMDGLITRTPGQLQRPSMDVLTLMLTRRVGLFRPVDARRLEVHHRLVLNDRISKTAT